MHYLIVMKMMKTVKKINIRVTKGNSTEISLAVKLIFVGGGGRRNFIDMNFKTFAS